MNWTHFFDIICFNVDCVGISFDLRDEQQLDDKPCQHPPNNGSLWILLICKKQINESPIDVEGLRLVREKAPTHSWLGTKLVWSLFHPISQVNCESLSPHSEVSRADQNQRVHALGAGERSSENLQGPAEFPCSLTKRYKLGGRRDDRLHKHH